MFYFVFRKLDFLVICFFLKPRFCNELELQQEQLIRKTAIYIAERANEICDIQGRQPSSIAAASIYLACMAVCEKKTKKG